MFGIKTKIKNIVNQKILSITKNNLSNEVAVRALMKNFHADIFAHCGNYDNADMGYGFFHYGLARTIRPKKILCIGSRHGFIPAIYAQACKDSKMGHVDFVDAGYGHGDKNHWTGVGFWKKNKGKNVFLNYGLDKFIRLNIMTSEQFAITSNDKFDIVYIDGNHSYKGVQLDFELFWPRLNNKGYMLFHDISVTKKRNEGLYGVHKLWKRISKSNAISFDFEYSGLGVLQKK